MASGSILLMLCNVVQLRARAQESSGTPFNASAQPNALQPAQTVSQSGESGSKYVGTASISGTVLDTSGDVVQSATVSLNGPSASKAQSVKSGNDGQFAFAGLPAGSYKVTVVGPGMSRFTSGPISLKEGEVYLLPPVILSVSGGVTTVTVSGNKEELAQEQVQIAVQQRVFKVFPNFYSSFDWNAPPMLAKQKYRLAARTLIDPVTFLTTGAIAGAEQYENVFPSFGSGIQGYGKRYAAAYASHASGELMTRAVFPSIFHSDPRYFIMGKGSTKARVAHALSSTFVTRGDDGSRKINFPELLGGFSAAALSNAYFPSQERGVSLVLINGFGDLGGDMLDNLIREFVLNHLTSRAKH
jgi:hypothetical protein